MMVVLLRRLPASGPLRPIRSARARNGTIIAAATQQQLIEYGGQCARCGKKQRHALPASQAALAAAAELRASLERHRRLDFDRRDGGSSSSSSSSSFSTLPFLPRSEGGNGGPGRMLGVLVCGDGTVLRAFSGQLAASASSTGEGGGGWRCPGWAGPVAGITNDGGGPRGEYGRFRALTDALSRRIAAAAASATATGDGGVRQDQQRLRARRRALSHALIARVQESYETRDLLGWRVSLREAYLALALADADADDGAAGTAAGPMPPPLPITRLSRCGGGEAWLGFPTGTGDCCAPKLLHEAALKGLEPVALAEFWFGAPPDGDDDGGGGGDGDGEEASPSSDGEADEVEGPGESKEEAWRRRQRRRVLKAGRRRAAAAVAGAATAPEASSRRRVHGHFYGPCAKCAGILGTMLCRCP